MIFSKWRYKAFILAVILPLAMQPAMAQTSKLNVQGAQQTGYARLVIDLPDAVEYELQQKGSIIQVIISGRFSMNVRSVLDQSLKQVSGIRASRLGNKTIVTFNVPRDASPRHFRSGQFLILDVYSQNSAPVYASKRSVKKDDGAEDDKESKAENDAEEAEDTAEPSAPADEAEEKGEENQEDTGDKEISVSDNSLAQLEDQTVITNTETVDVDIKKRAKLDGKLKVSGTADSDSEDEETIYASVEKTDDDISILFPWEDEVASAVFERGGALWVVFDQPYQLNADALVDASDDVFRSLKSLTVDPNPDALVIRLDLQDDQNAVMERRDTYWLLNIKNVPTKPRFPLAPARQASASKGQQIFIPATDIGRKIEVEDPIVGDILYVLPMLREGRGMAQTYNYASANVLETAQGVVIAPLTDFVTVERFTDGIAIRSSGNNILAATQLSRETGFGEDDAGFSRLIDFSAWRLGPENDYYLNKARLLYELSLQPAGERNDVRWKLARFFLAHGRAAETLGILARMLEEDPLLAQNTEYLAVRGVANFKHRRLDDAAKDLSARELEAEQDAELWRALTAEARGRYEETLEHYRRGKDVMGTYDDSDRAEIQLAVIRAAIETGDIELAQRELGLMNGLDLSEAQISESVYQSARIAEMEGRMDEALIQYDDLANVDQRWIAARARYSRIRFGVRNGDLQAVDAIDQLERLRYSWRGDRFEVQLIDDLSTLYFETGQYETGLELLRQALSYFPEEARERQMSIRMGQTFRDLFQSEAADRMTPIAAISLFYKFRELTPLGTEGDMMIRRLADRLVSVDLLDRAAELLEYQVRVRTEGAARAQIAAKLAKIYILNQEPGKAQEIIRATREPRLPDDILANRRWVEARALAELSRYEEAAVLLEGDRSADAEILRADIYWGEKNWVKLEEVIRRLLGNGWRRNETLNPLQRLNLIRLTIAMTFTENRAGLVEMRRRYGAQMRSGDFSNAFDLLTSDQELSGRELGTIAGQIASVEKLQSYVRDYRKDFTIH